MSELEGTLQMYSHGTLRLIERVCQTATIINNAQVTISHAEIETYQVYNLCSCRKFPYWT